MITLPSAFVARPLPSPLKNALFQAGQGFEQTQTLSLEHVAGFAHSLSLAQPTQAPVPGVTSCTAHFCASQTAI
jgi:hypothetical protein